MMADSTIGATELTNFQIAIVRVLEDEPRHGLGIKEVLEEIHEGDIHHGRLYPNLDDLVEDGLVEKNQIDKRTNQYELTDEAIDLLEEYRDWLSVEDGQATAGVGA